MPRAKHAFLSVSAVFACGAASPPTSVAPGAANAERAASLIARTKTTSTTYARYAWSRITPPNRPPIEEWAAEFNDGPLHRVETPRDRLIANCVERSGTAYSVATTEKSSGPGVAGIACGIDSTRPVISIRYIGPVSDPVGKADRVEVTDPERIRTYDITSDGIIIRTIIALNTPEKPVVLDEETQALERHLPLGNLFDGTSLDLSVVPDVYKRAPVKPNGNSPPIADINSAASANAWRGHEPVHSEG